MQIIPQGDWIVVSRKVGDTTSRGHIIGHYKRESDAKRDAKMANERMPDWHNWALRREDY